MHQVTKTIRDKFQKLVTMKDEAGMLSCLFCEVTGLDRRIKMRLSDALSFPPVSALGSLWLLQTQLMRRLRSSGTLTQTTSKGS